MESPSSLPSNVLGPSSPTSFQLSPLSSTSQTEESASSFSSVTTPIRSEKMKIPDFWREETQDCIENGIMDDKSRSDITRTLITLLTTKYGPRPGKNHCQQAARQLILKYPFMKDDLGSGYVSIYIQYIYIQYIYIYIYIIYLLTYFYLFCVCLRMHVCVMAGSAGFFFSLLGILGFQNARMY